MSRSTDWSNLNMNVKGIIKRISAAFLQAVFGVFPKQNKVVASTFNGFKYGDNTQAIVEELHKLDNSIEIVWMKDNDHTYEIPGYLRVAELKPSWKKFYEYATAKVWLDTHFISDYLICRKDQLYIQTWHGGLGIKKIYNDEWGLSKRKTIHDAQIASVFISNSDHLSNVYRSAFGYEGVIWKCGYPKNDMLFNDNTEARKKVREYYNLDADTKIIIYAPTLRSGATTDDKLSDLYGVDFERLNNTLHERFGGKWVVMARLHPNISDHNIRISYNSRTINATEYQDMQELIAACDAFVSDYSSCIFDAAMTEIPCFIFAKDFEEYKQDRGVYYEMEELPFPYAKNNDEFMRNIEAFDHDEYLKRWKAFAARTGLHETGHAAKDIAVKIKQFLDGEKIIWE